MLEKQIKYMLKIKYMLEINKVHAGKTNKVHAGKTNI
jgi:hypothetical protein